MGFTSGLPLFQMIGFGPLGLSLEAETYGGTAAMASELTRESSNSGSRYAHSGCGEGSDSLEGILGGRRERLNAAPSDPPSDPSSNSSSDDAKDVGGVRETAGSAPQRHTLKFVGGKYQGGEFPLRPGREIVIGRTSRSDIVLVEDTVSRMHAKLKTVGDRVVLQDLGSSAGTWVNGKRITTASLKEGDRILIGSTVFMLTAAETARPSDVEAETRARTDPPAPKKDKTPMPGCMSGLLDVVPLSDLLQLLSASQKSGVVTIRSGHEVGQICLRQGRVYHSSIEGHAGVGPHKAFYRMLCWSQGEFEFDPRGERKVREEIDAAIQSLLMEGVCQIDEIRRIEADLPSPESKLAVANPIPGRLRDLSPGELDVFQSVLESDTVGAVLDRYEGSDLEVYTHLMSLQKKGMVVI